MKITPRYYLTNQHGLTNLHGSLIILTLVLVGQNPMAAQTISNSGFNGSGGWSLSNDATLANPGGIAPWTWTTPVSPKLLSASESVLPTEGSGMGITYAGSDTFRQNVTFPNSGLFSLSVDANAIVGNVSNAGILQDGQFEFFVGGFSSSPYLVTATSEWANYQWTTFISAGTHNLGLRNTLSAVYSIAYDNFSVVPEPTSFSLFILSLLTIPHTRARRQR